MADDADATEARKKARQGDNDDGEELSDEEVEMVKELDKELGDEPPEVPDLDGSIMSSRYRFLTASRTARMSCNS